MWRESSHEAYPTAFSFTHTKDYWSSELGCLGLALMEACVCVRARARVNVSECECGWATRAVGVLALHRSNAYACRLRIIVLAALARLEK